MPEKCSAQAAGSTRSSLAMLRTRGRGVIRPAQGRVGVQTCARLRPMGLARCGVRVEKTPTRLPNKRGGRIWGVRECHQARRRAGRRAWRRRPVQAGRSSHLGLERDVGVVVEDEHDGHVGADLRPMRRLTKRAPVRLHTHAPRSGACGRHGGSAYRNVRVQLSKMLRVQPQRAAGRGTHGALRSRTARTARTRACLPERARAQCCVPGAAFRASP
jgi:hypothetical protein